MRFYYAVNGVKVEQQSALLRRTIKAILALWPARTGVIVFTMDLGEGGGCAYAANITRESAVNLLKEFLEKEGNKS